MPRAPYNTLVIPYRQRDDAFEFAVFHCRHASMCQFVAGGGEDDETPFNAARRELLEETSIEAPEGDWISLDAKASIPRTAFPGAPWPSDIHVVTEHCFAVLVEAQTIALSREHESCEWLSYERASKALTWDSNRVALFELNRRLQLAAGSLDC